MIAVIAAYAKNKIIGSKGKIPWDIPSDRRRFREITTGSVIIMGRKTYEEIGRPLPDRICVVKWSQYLPMYMEKCYGQK